MDHPESFAATLGVMLHPGEDEADREKARAFASHYLAKPIERFKEAGGALSREQIERIVTGSGDDARKDFLSVAHLWGAWRIREGKFGPVPEIGYEGWHDFQFFLLVS